MLTFIPLDEYLDSIDGIDLSDLGSDVIPNFVNHVVSGRHWNNFLSSIEPKKFSFYVARGPIIENAPMTGRQGVFEEFGPLKYWIEGIEEIEGISPSPKLPREIYDAGLIITPSAFYTSESIDLMCLQVENMLEAVEYYRERR